MASAGGGPDWLDWISLVGTFATIVGLILTLKVLRDAQRLQRHYVFLGRVPELVKTLETQGSRINSLLGGLPESADEISHELSRCQANLKSLRDKLPVLQQGSVDEVNGFIRTTLEQKPLERESVWLVYTRLSALGVEIRNILADRSWEA
jgi:hypothetical protein